MAYSTTQYLLTHLLQRVYRKLRNTRVSTATGGSATTIVDTKLADYLGDANEDDVLNSGTAIIIKDAGGSGASPEGKFARITDYVASTTTITIDTVADAVASGDTYLIASKDYPLFDMIEIVNDALQNLGRIPRVYSSLTSVAEQTEYTLPAYIKDSVYLVEWPVNAESGDQQWEEIYNWRIASSDPGSSGTLIIPQLPAGYTIRVWYYDNHPRVDDYDDPISEKVHPELAYAAVMAQVYEWYNSKTNDDNPKSIQREMMAKQTLEAAKALYPIPRMKRHPRGIPQWRYDTDERFAVIQ